MSQVHWVSTMMDIIHCIRCLQNSMSFMKKFHLSLWFILPDPSGDCTLQVEWVSFPPSACELASALIWITLHLSVLLPFYQLHGNEAVPLSENGFLCLFGKESSMLLDPTYKLLISTSWVAVACNPSWLHLLFLLIPLDSTVSCKRRKWKKSSQVHQVKSISTLVLILTNWTHKSVSEALPSPWMGLKSALPWIKTVSTLDTMQ
jgi:hypothetical protein